MMSCAGVAGLDHGFDDIRDPWPEDGLACDENALRFALVAQVDCVEDFFAKRLWNNDSVYLQDKSVVNY